MSARARGAALVVTALALVTLVLAVQLTHGGGRFAPTSAADPCAPRTSASSATGIDGLTERLVLLGVDDAACTLGVTREALTLELAGPGERTDAEIDALHDGLLTAVGQLDAEGALPPASTLLDDALDTADLNSVLEAALRAIPDSVVDGALDTDDVLTRTVDDLDLRTLLSNLDDEQGLETQVQAAVTSAVRAALLQRLRDLV